MFNTLTALLPLFIFSFMNLHAVSNSASSNPQDPFVNTTLDVEIPAGHNFALAMFRWWQPPSCKALQGVLVLLPGSNSDGRAEVDSPFWRKFAAQHELALVGCYFKDHPHADMNAEEYCRAGDGSGQALLDAVTQLAARASQPGIASQPLLLFGHSAGGQFNYEFACWNPSRVRAFVVNKGGYYYTHLAPAGTRALPGIFFIGDKDAEFRIQSIQGIFAINRQAGAAWKLVIEPGVGHDTGKSRELASEFFTSVLTQKD